MTVAFELGKTLDDMSEMSYDELVDWLAYIKVRNKKMQQKK